MIVVLFLQMRDPYIFKLNFHENFVQILHFCSIRINQVSMYLISWTWHFFENGESREKMLFYVSHAK